MEGKAAEKSNRKMAGSSSVIANCVAASSTSTTLARMERPGKNLVAPG